ncbi:adhesion G protein-coupled receptor E1-like [Anguilla anguilla]|uniref:adhesion G protein-coupled receptor E1-like n=1 Tax=Anguilla anguilla TaxID=7936 RepID=UPI0015B2AB2B|nr:adhesion G protein-coupled receptor E1-like [Anguilla anguilla]
MLLETVQLFLLVRSLTKVQVIQKEGLRALYLLLIGYGAPMVVLNLVLFGVILWCLRPTLANMKSDVSQSKDTRLIIFKIVAQFFVLGCAWILGFFQSSPFLKYLFIILNSQQGTFIFIVHCLLNKDVREEYKRWFSCLFRTKEPPGSGGSPNSVSTVQK